MSTPTNAATLTWTVHFTGDVTGVDLSDFALRLTDTGAAQLSGITGSGATYTVHDIATDADAATVRKAVLAAQDDSGERLSSRIVIKRRPLGRRHPTCLGAIVTVASRAMCAASKTLRILALLAVLTGMSEPTTVLAAEAWRRVDEADGIVVEVREVEGNDFPEFRGTGVVTAPMLPGPLATRLSMPVSSMRIPYAVAIAVAGAIYLWRSERLDAAWTLARNALA